MQCGEGAARDKRRDESADPQRIVHARVAVLRFLLAIQHPAEIDHHDREQVGRPAEEVEQEIRRECTHTAHAVVDGGAAGGLTKSRIRRVVGEQRVPEDECQHARDYQGALAQRSGDLRGNALCRLRTLLGSCHI